MKAVAWHGPRDIRVDEVADPRIEQPTDAVVRITTTAICGSDLHLYEALTPFLRPGDILGHEPIGVVEEVGGQVDHISPGDRVVIPFNISCGHCWMCERGWYAQCEITQNREYGMGASLFGYTTLYGQVPGGQAELLRVTQAQFGPIKVPPGPPDERFVYLSDVLPTAWQAVEYAEIPPEGTVVVFGLGPVGQMSARIAAYRGARVIGVDLVPERNEMARRHGVEVLDPTVHQKVPAALRDLTDGRGPDSVIDAVGMEAHGSPIGQLAHKLVAALPHSISAPLVQKAGIDRLAVLYQCIDTVRRAGTISISGVYGGMADPLPLLTLFDKGVRIAMGQAHVKRWIDDLMPLVTDDADPLGYTTSPPIISRWTTHPRRTGSSGTKKTVQSRCFYIHDPPWTLGRPMGMPPSGPFTRAELVRTRREESANRCGLPALPPMVWCGPRWGSCTRLRGVSLAVAWDA